MFYTVFSTNDSPYMQWQSDLLEYTWNQVGQEGVLIRLVATDKPDQLPQQKHAHSFATDLWDVHPDTGDAYPIYNKPASLLEWVFKDRPDGTVLILDPDCVFRAPVTQRVAPGYPASQKWIDCRLVDPGGNNPFGLGEDFAFLNDHCARTDLSADPVMIPTLIHTTDLRRIGARWLELCSVMRQHFRNSDGEPMWESDMFAYVAACAEYGLRHQPISLGICTNWKPEDVPDAPIIHYCQPILANDGREIFSKHFYRTWERPDEAAVPVEDYGRDLVRIVNDFIDDENGIVRPASLDSRPKWRKGVMEGRVVDDMLLEIPADARSLWLNGSGKAIWELCDGSHSVDEIATSLSRKYSTNGHDLTADVQSTVGQLRAAGFLDLS